MTAFLKLTTQAQFHVGQWTRSREFTQPSVVGWLYCPSHCYMTFQSSPYPWLMNPLSPPF